MRARAAYIHSLGTTSILVASALLMLAVVSAIVAFRGWPQPTASSDVPSVPLQPPPARVAKVVPLQAAASARLAAAGSSVATLTRTLVARSSTSGLVKQVSGDGPSTPHMAPAPALPTSAASPPAPARSHGSPPPPGDPNTAPVEPVAGTVQSLLPQLPTVPGGSGPGGDGSIALPVPRGMQAAYRVLGY
jgi:hypothetical protein